MRFRYVDPADVVVHLDEDLPWGEDSDMWMVAGHRPLATQQRRFLVAARGLGCDDFDAAAVMRLADIAHLYLTVVAGSNVEARSGYPEWGSLHRAATMHSTAVTAWLPEHGVAALPYLPDHTRFIGDVW